MIENATLQMSYQRVIHLPPGGRPRWVSDGGRNNELQYLSWGWREYGRHPVPVSLHEGWTYQYVSEGCALLDTGQKRIPLERRHLAIIGPSCPNGWRAAKPEDRCSIFTWIWRAAPQFGNIDPGETGWRIFSVSPEEDKRVRSLHEETRREIARADEAAPHAIHAIRSRIDILLTRGCSPKKIEPDHGARVEYALNWLRLHPEELRPVYALSDYLQASPATLNRLFRSRLGRSVREVAYSLRMEAARSILEAENIPVKELSFRLGYSHPNDFTRAYGRYWGKSPTEAG